MQGQEILKAAQLYKTLRSEKEEMERQLKTLTAQIEQTMNRLSDLMLENDMPGFRHDGAQFSLATTTRASAMAGAKEDLYQALRENGYGDMVYETVNANSLSSFVKEQIEQNGDKLPDWLLGKINVFQKTTVRLQKS